MAGVTASRTLDQRIAVGPLTGLPAALKRALSADGFLPLPPPETNDWLDAHPEHGQSFAEFVKARPAAPEERRRAITLLPIGDLPVETASSLELLREYLGAFYGLPARLLPSMSLDEAQARSRVHPVIERRQLLAPDLLDRLEARKPNDAFAALGITGEDLYPRESWNYVFGLAAPRRCVAVLSVARHDPTFHGDPPRPEEARLRLRRTLKTLSHEMGHLLGVKHCIFFSCLMNGANSLDEADGRPMHVCPVCLRKLQQAIGFDVVERYEGLERVYRAAGFPADASWVMGQLRQIRG